MFCQEYGILLVQVTAFMFCHEPCSIISCLAAHACHHCDCIICIAGGCFHLPVLWSGWRVLWGGTVPGPHQRAGSRARPAGGPAPV